MNLPRVACGVTMAWGAIVSGCGQGLGPADAGFNGGPVFDGGPPAGTAITTPKDTWTWVDFPDSACSEGTPTGIGLYPSSTSSNLILYMQGGGACWDYLTCYTLGIATAGPYGQSQFNSDKGQLGGSILDSND